MQAEGSQEAERHRLAGRALAEVTAIRAARMRLYGSTAPDTTRSRKHEALALLLLGEPERAGQALELTLATGRPRLAAPTARRRSPIRGCCSPR